MPIMMNYDLTLRDLGYPAASQLSHEAVAELFVTYANPVEWYGFPPALVPILSDGTWPLYVGLWKHWFVPRQPSFVELNVNLDHKVEEVARDDRQLAALMLLRLIVLRDGIDEDVRRLAARLGVGDDDLARLDAHTPEHADFPEDLPLLPEFAEHPPQFSVEDGTDYDGEFPTGDVPRYSSYFEYDPDMLAGMSDLPPWLDPATDKPALFETYLAAGDFGAAWLTLNGTGWIYPVAAKALQRLRDSAPADPVFHQIADEWIRFATDQDGGY